LAGLNTSAGISYNKFLEKLASDHRKPNGQYVITPETGPAFVETLLVGKFHGIGPATSAKMNALGPAASTCTTHRSNSCRLTSGRPEATTIGSRDASTIAGPGEPDPEICRR
jgi:nucleotidyltransferase/DNA polymerase involved in DNA repair